MSLTLTEIHRINTGIVRPDDLTLMDLIVLQTRRHANYLRNNLKDIEDNPLAESYKKKMQVGINKVIQNDVSIAKNILPHFTNAIGNTQDYSDIKALDTDGWISLVESEIAELFEMINGITPEEKQAYDDYQ